MPNLISIHCWNRATLIYVPQRPSTVTVLGQVLQPGSFPYEEKATVRDYLDAAGGTRNTLMSLWHSLFCQTARLKEFLNHGSVREMKFFHRAALWSCLAISHHTIRGNSFLI